MRLKFVSSIGSALRVAFMGVIRASSYYAIVDGPTWTQADANAVAIGGHLAALSSEGEHLWLAQEFSKSEYYYDGDSNSGDPDSWTHFWLGGKKESGAGHGLIMSLGLMVGNMTGDCRITQHLEYTTT